MNLWAWKQKLWLQLAVIYTRYVLGGAFVFASVVKIKGERFTMVPGAGSPFHSPQHLFETLYQSGLYWEFLGLAQLLAGLLLMTQRYALLGALLFLPIVANIYVITISYDFGYTSVITGAMLATTLALLLWDWPRLRVLFNQPVLPLPALPMYERPWWQAVGLVLFCFTAGYRAVVAYYNPVLWFGVCALIGVGGLLAAWVRPRQVPRGA
jgi:hypothetical protein